MNHNSMASTSFLDRFKDRSSSLNRSGELDTSSSKPVSASLSQSHGASNIQRTGQMVVRGDSPSHGGSLSFTAEQRKFNAEPTGSILRPQVVREKARLLQSPPKKAVVPPVVYPSNYTEPSTSLRSSLEFVPYTLREYEVTRPTEYQKFGGLGPAIGTEEWKRQKEARDRRIEYAKLIQDVNSSRLPGLVSLQQDRDRKKLNSARERALELAKKLSLGSKKRADSAEK